MDEQTGLGKYMTGPRSYEARMKIRFCLLATTLVPCSLLGSEILGQESSLGLSFSPTPSLADEDTQVQRNKLAGTKSNI